MPKKCRNHGLLPTNDIERKNKQTITESILAQTKQTKKKKKKKSKIKVKKDCLWKQKRAKLETRFDSVSSYATL